MNVTVTLECDPSGIEAVRYHFDVTASVDKPEYVYSDERGGFSPKVCEIEIQSVLLTDIVVTCELPNSEIHCVEKDPLPPSRWLDYVVGWLERNPLSKAEFEASACEAADEEDDAARELAAERWLEARGLA